MTSLSTGASRKVPATTRLSVARDCPQQADLGRPEARWRQVRSPLGRALARTFFATAQPLLVWQKRLRDRAYLERMPDYLLRDIGLDASELRAEAGKPFWRS